MSSQEDKAQVVIEWVYTQLQNKYAIGLKGFSNSLLDDKFDKFITIENHHDPYESSKIGYDLSEVCIINCQGNIYVLFLAKPGGSGRFSKEELNKKFSWHLGAIPLDIDPERLTNKVLSEKINKILPEISRQLNRQHTNIWNYSIIAGHFQDSSKDIRDGVEEKILEKILEKSSKNLIEYMSLDTDFFLKFAENKLGKTLKQYKILDKKIFLKKEA